MDKGGDREPCKVTIAYHNFHHFLGLAAPTFALKIEIIDMGLLKPILAAYFLLFLPAFPSSTLKPALTKTVYQFPNTTWIENIATTRNGSLLVSVLGRASGAELYLINPFSDSPIATLVEAIQGADSAFGITELSEDVFAVITSTYDLTNGPSVGSSSVWTVDLSPRTNGEVGVPAVKKIADIKIAQFLNGAVALNPTTVLLADSFGGNVVALDISTGKYGVVLKDASMLPDGTGPVPIGVNGLKVRDGYLYYSNTIQNSLSRVKIDKKTGKPLSKFERITSGLSTPDDFSLLPSGSVILAEPLSNTVVKVSAKGVVTPIAGSLDSSLVAGVTSVSLGRTSRDKGVAYVVTNGGLSGRANGTEVEGGKVIGIWL